MHHGVPGDHPRPHPPEARPRRERQAGGGSARRRMPCPTAPHRGSQSPRPPAIPAAEAAAPLRMVSAHPAPAPGPAFAPWSCFQRRRPTITRACAAGPGRTALRRGARVVDRGGLENRCAFAGTVGSNPTLSASMCVQSTDKAAPAALGCARMNAASRNVMPCWRPRSWTRASRRPHTPRQAQRMKVCAAIHHGPRSAGSIRHPAPLSWRQRIAPAVRRRCRDATLARGATHLDQRSPRLRERSPALPPRSRESAERSQKPRSQRAPGWVRHARPSIHATQPF